LGRVADVRNGLASAGLFSFWPREMSKPSSARITSFLIKIASRCNLACDYCYVYEHADQSWKSQPAFMADETIHALAHRIGE